MKRPAVCAVMCWVAACVRASPIVETLDATMTRYQVDVATNNEVTNPNNPFPSDSLAASASGTLYSADAHGRVPGAHRHAQGRAQQT